MIYRNLCLKPIGFNYNQSVQGMFIPDTLRSCMIETDVSSYLQTSSTGQVSRINTFYVNLCSELNNN